MSLWLFNIFIKGVLRESRVMSKINDIQIVKNGAWLLVMLVFANDLVLIAKNAEDSTIITVF